MSRNGLLGTRRKFVSTGKKTAIINACQHALENLEERRLLSTAVGASGEVSAHERHVAHVHHLSHLKQMALLGGVSSSPVAAPLAAPLGASPLSVIQPGTDVNSNQYLGFRAVDGIVTDPNSDGVTWNVVSGTAADGIFTTPSAGEGAPVLQASSAQPANLNNNGLVTYSIHFNAPGDYKLYVRDKYELNDGTKGDNSMFVPSGSGAISASPTLAYDNDTTGADGRADGNYSWDVSVPNVVYHIAAAGDTTITFSMREKNYFIDRVVLSTDQTLTGGSLDALTNTPITVGAPQTLTGTVSGQNVNLNWGLTPGADAYTIKRGTVSGGPYTTLQTGVTGTTAIDTVPANGNYFYVVVATKGGVDGSGTSPEFHINVTGQLQPPTGVTTTSAISKVTISWTPPTGGATGFDVKRGTSAAGPFTTIGANVPGNSFDDTTAAVNTVYYYVVSALKTGSPASVDSAPPVAGNRVYVGTGDGWSALYYADNLNASGTPQYGNIAPFIDVEGQNAPTGLGQLSPATWPSIGSGVPSTFNSGFAHDQGTNFSIRWEGMVQAQYNEQYTLYAASDDGIQVTVDGVVVDPNLNTARGITEDTIPLSTSWVAGSLHDVVVQFVEIGGGWAYWLKWSSTSTPKANVPQSQVQAILPSAPTLSAVSNNGSVALSWTPVAASSYTVLRSTGGGAYSPIATNLTGTTYTDNAVTNGTTYSYEVKGSVQLGTGPASTPVSATPNPQPPLAPTGVAVTARQNAATVSWAATAFASSYNILRGPVGGPYAPLAAGTGVTGTSFTDNTAVLGQIYAYEVVANNVSGSSPASAPATGDLLNGSIVHYYNDAWWKSPVQNNTGFTSASLSADGTVINPGLNIDWGTGSPDNSTPGTRTDNFSTITTAQITIDAATAADPILFGLQSDDDGQLYIDGTLVASDPGGHGFRDALLGGSPGTPHPITLSAGKHSIVFYQAEQGGGAGTKLRWQTHYVGAPALALQFVPNNLITAVSGAPAKPDMISAVGAPGTGAIIQYYDNATNEISYTLQRSTTPTFDLGTVQNVGTQGIHDNAIDSNITFIDGSNQLTQKLYYRVVAVNFEGSTASDSLSVDAQSFISPGVAAHFFNNEWWKSADQSTFAPITKGASVSADASTIFSDINNTTGAQATGPIAGIPGANFSSVFTGKFTLTTGGNYTFNTQTDDDSYLYVDGVLVSADPGGHGLENPKLKNPIALLAGDHNYQFFHSQGTGGWGYQFQYNGPDTGNVDAIAPSSIFTNSISDPLAAPGALTFSNISAGAITVNWGDTNLDEIRYVIERSTDNFASNDVIVTAGINATSFTDLTVAPSTSYSYRVHAENFDFVGPSVSGTTASIAPVGAGGTITSANPVTPATQVDLTSVGTRDWAHWGVNTANTFDHRGAATEHISDVTLVNGAAKNQYTTSPTAFSWNNGGPYNTTVTNTITGIYTGGVGKGFEFTAPADTTTRRLYVYVGVLNATGKLTAHLTDGSAVQFTNATLDNTSATTATAGLYTIDYKAASAGQALIVDWTESADHGSGVIALGAAALGTPTDFVTPSYVTVQQGAYTGRVSFVNNTPNATSLVLQRSTDPNFGAGTITTFNLSGKASGFSDPGPFTVGTRYYYRVEALGTGGVSTAFSAPGSFVYRPVPIVIDHSAGFAPPTLDFTELLTDGSFETPPEAGGNFYYQPTGGSWTFTGTTGIIAPPSPFGTPSAAVDGNQYLFVQTNTGDAHSDAVNGQTVSQTVAGFVAGQKYVFSVYDAARNGQAPVYKVTLDPGTAAEKVIFIGSTNSNTFTQEFSAAFTATAGSHVLQIASVGTTDNTVFLDKASIAPYISGVGSSDLTLNYNTPVGAVGGSGSPVLPLVTPDGKLELTEGQNNDDRSAFETTSVPMSGDFKTSFDFQNSGNIVGANGADGFTFAIQANSPTALGGGGGGLGIQGVPNSVAIQFNMYNNVTQTGILINGEAPGNNRVDMTSLGNAFHVASPTDIFHVTLTYDYASKTLTETVVDTGSTVAGGTPIATFTKTYTVDIPTVLGGLGSNAFGYVGFTGATGGANSFQDILNWTFQAGPTVIDSNFLYQSGPRQITMKFNEDVSASLQASDLVVHNITTNADVSPGTLSYNATTNTATWTFASLTNGNYHASLALGGVNDTSSLHVGASAVDFFWLNGDSNHDRTVDFTDLVAVAQHYGQASGGTLVGGDLDGDGTVGFPDLVAVAQNYGTTLAPLPGATPAAPAPSSPVLSQADEVAVLSALPDGPAKTFALNLIGQTAPSKPAPVTTTTNPVTTPVGKPAPVSIAPVTKPSAFSTTRITPTSVVKQDSDLLS